MKVGDKVFLKAVGNNARRRNEVFIKEDEISKIGRKYFEVGGGSRPLKFLIENNSQEASDRIADWELYFDKQQIFDEEEAEKLSWEIKTAFNGYGKTKFALDQLRRIHTILKE